MKQGVSVVICTYNRAYLIPKAIAHIAQQQVREGVDWEFIIVDNASTDDTAQVALSEWTKHQNSTRFTILNQEKQGLSFARDLALKAAAYEFVLFCDDDNWLAPNYVDLAYHIMVQHPSIGVLGGYGELVFEADTSQLTISHSAYANGPQSETSGKVKHNIIYGAGFVVRKTAYETIFKAGVKPMLTDRMGNCLSAGGDWELCLAIALAGYDIWYDENLRFKHFITEERTSWNYCVRLVKEGARSFEVLVPYRTRVNKGCKNLRAFNISFLKMLAFQVTKLLPLLTKGIKLPPQSNEAKLNKLRVIALRERILSFRKYSAMKKNFLKILEYEKRMHLKMADQPKATNDQEATRFSKV